MSQFINSSVYSLIREEYSGKTLSDAFLRLTLIAIRYTGFRPFHVQEICEEFNNYIGFNIPYHPMKIIISKLKNRGYLWESADGVFYPKREDIERDITVDLLAEEQQKLDHLIKCFVRFCKDKEENLSDEDAEKAIDNFIDLNGLDLLRGVEDYSNITDDTHIRLFYTFYAQLVANDTDLIDFIDSLIVGRILTDLFISGQDENMGVVRSNATVYLDTSVVFSLLGVDEIDRSKVFEELISSTQNLGMKVRIFRHTYQELITLIQGSEEWIYNPYYNPLCATSSTRYFVSNNYSRDDVVDFADSLQAKLKHFGIEIDEKRYPDINPIGVKTEREYYDLIVEKYSASSKNFDESLKQKTIDKDARSLYYIDHMNAGIRATDLRSISNIFVTTNNTLAFISREFVQPNTSEIPDCVNDVYWGTLIWLNNPQQLLSTTKIRLAANAYAVFLPSTKLKKKLIEATEHLAAENEISAEEAYFLKSSGVAQRLMMEMTKGNDKFFTEKTPLDILMQIKNEAKQQGHFEERKLADTEISDLKEKFRAFQEQSAREKKKNEEELYLVRLELVQTQIRALEREKTELNRKISEQNERKEKAERKNRTGNRIITGFMLLIAVASVFFTYKLYQVGNNNGKDYLGILSSILTLILFFIPCIFHFYAGRPFDRNFFISDLLNKKLIRQYKRFGYDEYEDTKLKERLSELELRIHELENSQLEYDRTVM